MKAFLALVVLAAIASADQRVSTYNRPSYNRPTYSRPSYNRPSYNRPTYNRPSYNRPSYNRPSYHENTYENDYAAPAYYNYGYEVNADYEYGPRFSASESRDGDVTNGQYSVDLPDGRTQTVTYNVDGYSGYVADVQYYGEPQYSEHKPSYQEPSYRPASYQPTYRPASYKPTYRPVYRPSTYRPAYQRPSYRQPVHVN